jgi:hypothetical protein
MREASNSRLKTSSPASSGRRFWRSLLSRCEPWLFLLLLLCYTYFLPRWADPNQNSRLDMVVAVVENGTFRIDPYVENTVDYAKVGEHYYSDKAPGAAFLGIPVYAGLKSFLQLPILDSVMDWLTRSEALEATLREGGTGLLTHKVRFAIAQVALTIMYALGLPVPRRMDGRVLLDASAPVHRGTHSVEFSDWNGESVVDWTGYSDQEEQVLLEQLRRLGYID